MKYAHCECGKHEMWSSDGIPLCVVCEHCATTLLTDEFGRRKPQQPHQWQKLYDQHTGQPYRRCRRCGEKREISARPPNRPGTPLNADGTMLGPWDKPSPGGQRG